MESTDQGGVPFGRYRIRRRLGRGGMGEVFLADQLGPHGPLRQVALKRMLPRLTGDAGAQRLFLDEMGTAAQLNHPNIATTYDFGEVDGVYFLAMEYVEGVTLERLVATLGPISIPVAAAIAQGVLAALAPAHSRRGEPVVHQDISPHNVMISVDGVVKLLDFGIAKAEAAVLGDRLRAKIAYAAPEQLRGESPDRRFDLWALGVTIYEAVTGSRPFSGTTLEEVLAVAEQGRFAKLGEVRPEALALGTVIDRALDPRAEDRWPTAERFAAALSSAIPAPATIGELAELARSVPSETGKDLAEITGTGVAAIVPELKPTLILSATVKTPRPKRRSRWPLITAGLAFGAILVGAWRLSTLERSSPTVVAPKLAIVEPPAPPAETEPPVATPPPAIEASPELESAPTTEPSPRDRRRRPSRPKPAIVVPPPPPPPAPPPESARPSDGGLGVLAVRTTPWAKVALDGQPLGDGIIAGKPVAAGRHRLTLTPGDPKFAPRTLDIEVKAGGVTKIFADFATNTVRVQAP